MKKAINSNMETKNCNYYKLNKIFFNELDKSPFKYNILSDDLSEFMVKFTITDCPGWTFGLWWEHTEKDNCHTGIVFAMYEEIIDKFKPSCAVLKETIRIYNDISGDVTVDNFFVYKMIKYIHKEPYLAFYQDYYLCDYNRQYVTRHKAKKEFKHFIKKHKAEKEFNKKYNSILLSFVKKYALPMYKGAHIVDHGENFNPKYEIFAPFEENRDIVDGPGCYAAINYEDVDIKIRNKYNRIIKKGEKIAAKHHFYWNRCIDDDIIFTKEMRGNLK